MDRTDRTSKLAAGMLSPLVVCLTTLPLRAADGENATAGAAQPPAATTVAAQDAEEDYRYLAGLVERELWDLAVPAGEAFLREHGGHARAPLARYRLSTALFALERHAQALPHWTRLAQEEDFEYRTEADFRAGECELALDRPADAAARFARVAEGSQQYLHEPAAFLLGEARFRSAQHDAAAAAYGRYLERFADGPSVADARRALAWCAWETGDAAGAAARAREFLRRHSGDGARVEVGLLLGEALLETKDHQEALRVFGELPEDGPGGDAVLRGRGFALAATGRPADAARAFGLLLERFPTSRFADEGRLQQGAQLVTAGTPAEAVDVLAPLVAAGSADACLWSGRAHEALGDATAALAAFDRGLSTGAEGALAERLHVARGDALNALGRGDEARAAYGRGGSDYALHAAAVTALNSGDPRAAERLAETLLKRGDEAEYRGPTLLVLGEARFLAERWDAAETAFASALEYAEDDAARTRARSRMAWCRYLSEDLAGAAAGFGELAREHPDCPEAEEALRMAARALEESGARGPAADAWKAYLARYAQAGAAPEDVTAAWIALARTTDDGEERARALGAAADADTAGRDGARALLNLAEDLATAGDGGAAAARYEQLLERVQGEDLGLESRARYGLAWCRFDEERFRDAAALLAPLADPQRLATLRAEDEDLAGSGLELLAWSLAAADLPNEASGVLGILNEDARTSESPLLDGSRRFELARAAAAAWQRAGQPARGQALYEVLTASLAEPALQREARVEALFLALEAGALDAADTLLDAAADGGADDPAVLEASFFVAEAHLAAGNEERALVRYAPATAPASPLAADALYKRGFVLLGRAQEQRAADDFRALVERHADSPLLGEALFLLGEAEFRRDRHAEAVVPLARLLEEQPRHAVRPKALFRLGLALGRLERWEPCAERLATLAKEAPEFPNLAEAELWRGRALAALARRRPARAALERVLQLDRGALAAEARVVLGNLLQEETRHEDALSEYLKVAVLYAHPPAVSEALFRAGVSLEALERPEDAAERYREVLEDHAESAWADRARTALTRLEGAEDRSR